MTSYGPNRLRQSPDFALRQPRHWQIHYWPFIGDPPIGFSVCSPNPKETEFSYRDGENSVRPGLKIAER